MKLKEINSKYGIDTKLLKQYFQAFSNLYGICPLQKAIQIINYQNPELKLTEEQILGFADNYAGDWRTISPDEVYSNVPVTTPMCREIVNKLLVYYNDYSGYNYVRNHHVDKDFYVPEKDELLKYAQKEYYEENQYTEALAQLLKEQLHINDWQRKSLEIVLNLRLDNFDIQAFVDTIEQEFPHFEFVEQAIDIYINLHNTSRLMVNRGHTPAELSCKYNPHGTMPTSISFGSGMQNLIQSGEINKEELVREFETMNISQELKRNLIAETDKTKQSNPGRNDPCPCGSGKKYKKCCGR